MGDPILGPNLDLFRGRRAGGPLGGRSLVLVGVTGAIIIIMTRTIRVGMVVVVMSGGIMMMVVGVVVGVGVVSLGFRLRLRRPDAVLLGLTPLQPHLPLMTPDVTVKEDEPHEAQND